MELLGGCNVNDGDTGTCREINSSVNQLRVNPSAVYLDGSVFIAIDDTIEMLSLSFGQWTIICNCPSTFRYLSSMCVFNGQIVVSGELS